MKLHQLLKRTLYRTQIALKVDVIEKGIIFDLYHGTVEQTLKYLNGTDALYAEVEYVSVKTDRKTKAPLMEILIVK